MVNGGGSITLGVTHGPLKEGGGRDILMSGQSKAMWPIRRRAKGGKKRKPYGETEGKKTEGNNAKS